MSLIDWLLGRKASSTEHYLLRCTECDFTHHVPRDTTTTAGGVPLEYVVDVAKARLTCMYGPVGDPRRFTVTLQVREFFTVAKVAATGQTLSASISENIKPLHRHMLSHADPLFLSIRQTENSTSHVYARDSARVNLREVLSRARKGYRWPD